MESGFGSPDYAGFPHFSVITVRKRFFEDISATDTKIKFVFKTVFGQNLVSLNGGAAVSIEFSDDSNVGVPVDMASTKVNLNLGSLPTAPQMAWRIAHAINNASNGDFYAEVPGTTTVGDSFWSTGLVQSEYAGHFLRSKVSLPNTEPAASINGVLHTTSDAANDYIAHVAVWSGLNGSSKDFYRANPRTSLTDLPENGGTLVTLPSDYTTGSDISIEFSHKETVSGGNDSPIYAETYLGGTPHDAGMYPGAFESTIQSIQFSANPLNNGPGARSVYAPQRWLYQGDGSLVSGSTDWWGGLSMGAQWNLTGVLKAKYDWGHGASVDMLWDAADGVPWDGAPELGVGSEVYALSTMINADTAFGSPYGRLTTPRQPVPIKPPRRIRDDRPRETPPPSRAIQDSGGTILAVYADVWPDTIYRLKFRATGTSNTFPQGASTFCLSYKPNEGIDLRPTRDLHYIRFIAPVLPPGIYDLIITAPRKPDFDDMVVHRFIRVTRRVRNRSVFSIRNSLSNRYNAGSRRFTTELVRLGGAGK